MPWKPKQHGTHHKPRARDTRPSAAARGYDYRWQQFRVQYLAEHPLCEDCTPIIRAATDVHHRQKLRDRPDLKYDHENLVALCSDCHDARTARGE